VKSKVGSGFVLAVLTVAALVSPTSGWADIPTAERNALIALYNSTNGDGWINRANWKVGSSFNTVGTECTWNGVMCNAAGDAVTRVILNVNNLSGTLPAELGNLPALEFLDLSGNSLTGFIPPALGNLSNLLSLALNNNSLIGFIPPELGDLSALSELNLQVNLLIGSIPPELGDATQLWQLNLSSNLLIEGIPPELGGLSVLDALILDHNQLSGSIPPELGDLNQLRTLWLNSNQLTGSIPSELGNGSGYMNDMRLSNNQLSGSIPASLGDFPNLQVLDLDRNQLTGSIPPELGGNKPFMWRFNLSHNQLSGSIPSALYGNGCTPSYIYLDNNQLSGSLPASLGNMVGGELFLHSNQLSGAIPPEWINIWVTDGTGLDLRWNALYSDDPAIIAQLDVDQIGGDWQSSQTIAPENPSISSTADHTVWLDWDAAGSTPGAGGYALYVKETISADWLLNGIVASKTTVSFPVTGLDPGKQYDFAVATYTDPHLNNRNRVMSDPSPLVNGMTASTGCEMPIISIGEIPKWTLGVTEAFDSYLWSTGESTQSIFVNPPEETSYWVTTTFGGCEESAAVTVSPVIFSDGFENGTTTQWSSVGP
jgi:Leucine-rich repeat (LRR) protein